MCPAKHEVCSCHPPKEDFNAHNSEVLHHVLTLDQALALGVNRNKVYRLVKAGEWRRLHEGVFLTNPNLEDEQLWKAELAGHLMRGGSGAMVSHGSAALLHKLEGTFLSTGGPQLRFASRPTIGSKSNRQAGLGTPGRPIEITIPTQRWFRAAGVYRSEVPENYPLVIDGFLVTSLVRTLFDLARFHDVAVVEQALESALRGRDQFRPDVWNKSLLDEIRAFGQVNASRPGSFLLKTILDQRSLEDRPTGSFPETLLFQALRALGIRVVRQASVRITDANGFVLDTFFPDLCIPEFGLLIEVDGLNVHSTQDALIRDRRRQNKLVRGFRILRFAAADILKAPDRVAEDIRRSTLRLPLLGSTWTTDEVRVSYALNEFLVENR
jgi:very-short-patch-repair endonuclease